MDQKSALFPISGELRLIFCDHSHQSKISTCNPLVQNLHYWFKHMRFSSFLYWKGTRNENVTFLAIFFSNLTGDHPLIELQNCWDFRWTIFRSKFELFSVESMCYRIVSDSSSFCFSLIGFRPKNLYMTETKLWNWQLHRCLR